MPALVRRWRVGCRRTVVVEPVFGCHGLASCAEGACRSERDEDVESGQGGDDALFWYVGCAGDETDCCFNERLQNAVWGGYVTCQGDRREEDCGGTAHEYAIGVDAMRGEAGQSECLAGGGDGG